MLQSDMNYGEVMHVFKQIVSFFICSRLQLPVNLKCERAGSLAACVSGPKDGTGGLFRDGDITIALRGV